MVVNLRTLAAVGGAGIVVAMLTGGDDESESSESDESECPICGETVDPRGLSGHLQFGHGVAGEDVSEVISSESAEIVEVTNGSA